MLANLFRGRPGPEVREMQPWGDWSPSTGAAGNVSSATALNLLTVYGCVALISDTIATLPRDVYRREGGVVTEVAPPAWLEQPNERTDIVEFITQVLSSLLLDGNAYVSYTSDRSFKVTGMTVLDPAQVTIRTEDDRPTYWLGGQRFTGRMLHVKAWMRAGAVKGMSPIEAARQSVGLGLAAQEYASKFYTNGAHLSGVVQFPGQMTEDDAKILKMKWGRDHQGLARAHEPGVLTGGATWNPISVTPEQAQFLDTRKFQAGEIAAQMFRVDPTLLGIPVDGKSLTYANLEQRGIHLVQFTLIPWIVRLERMFSSLLARPQFLKFNVAGLERADLKTRYEAYSIGLGGQPFLVPDEPREKEDLGPMPKQEMITDES